MGIFRDREHLLRLGLLFVAGGLLFLIARAVFVPADFGLYGHYRAGALDDDRNHPLVFAGRAACAGCHAKQADELHAGKHARLGCESCHGALAAHAAAPKQAVAQKLETPVLCPSCHGKNAAKPHGFPQVVVEEHNAGAACGDCHQPHSPAMG